MLNQEYKAAEQYLRSVTTMQTDRLFLVNSHHAILDALFNTKATFFFSVRNTSAPVKIHDGNIRTTKSNPALHGFGLSNIKLILNKYAADFIIDYADGWFQFTGEIEL